MRELSQKEKDSLKIVLSPSLYGFAVFTTSDRGYNTMIADGISEHYAKNVILAYRKPFRFDFEYTEYYHELEDSVTYSLTEHFESIKEYEEKKNDIEVSIIEGASKHAEILGIYHRPKMNFFQRESAIEICRRFNVKFDEGNFHNTTLGLPDGYFCSQVGSIYIGIDILGRISS